MIHFCAADYKKAGSLFEKALSLDEENDQNRFAAKLAETRPRIAQRQTQLAPLLARLRRSSLDIEGKRTLLKQMIEVDADDAYLWVDLAFCSAAGEDWNEALQYADNFLTLDGRESAGHLRVGLLVPEILNAAGRRQEARTALEAYLDTINDNWYRMVVGCLLNPQKETDLAAKFGDSPEYMLTGYAALGFWSEGLGDRNKAIEYYREALGSYMGNMIEYDLAAQRIKRLRQAAP